MCNDNEGFYFILLSLLLEETVIILQNSVFCFLQATFQLWKTDSRKKDRRKSTTKRKLGEGSGLGRVQKQVLYMSLCHIAHKRLLKSMLLLTVMSLPRAPPSCWRLTVQSSSISNLVCSCSWQCKLLSQACWSSLAAMSRSSCWVLLSLPWWCWIIWCDPHWSVICFRSSSALNFAARTYWEVNFQSFVILSHKIYHEYEIYVCISSCNQTS